MAPLASSFATLSFQVEQGIALVTLDRPEARNAFNARMLADLLEVFDRIDADDGVRCVILTGAGKVFCAGADLEEGFGVGGGEGEAFRDRGGQVSLRIRACHKPVIGVINGAAAGAGAAMLLACDVRIAADTARILFPYVRLGLAPEGCVSFYLPRLVGVSRALEWTLWGATVEAEEALASGLVSAVLPIGEAMALARQKASGLGQTSPVSVAVVRHMVWEGAGVSDPQDIHLTESRMVAWRRQSADIGEGVSAFREKRPAVFPQSVSGELSVLSNL